MQPADRDTRSASTRLPSLSRPPLVRSHTTPRKSHRNSASASVVHISEERLERRGSDAKQDRAPGILGSIFGIPKPPEIKPERQ